MEESEITYKVVGMSNYQIYVFIITNDEFYEIKYDQLFTNLLAMWSIICIYMCIREMIFSKIKFRRLNGYDDLQMVFPLHI